MSSSLAKQEAAAQNRAQKENEKQLEKLREKLKSTELKLRQLSTEKNAWNNEKTSLEREINAYKKQKELMSKDLEKLKPLETQVCFVLFCFVAEMYWGGRG